MTEKLDPRDIVRDHFSTLKNARTGKTSTLDVLVFFGLPGIFGIAFLLVTAEGYSNDASTLWIAALSVLAGLLINVLVLLYTVQTVGPTPQEHDDQKAVIKEVNANLLYAILIAILAICALCGSPMMPTKLSHWLGAIITFLIGNFMLTLLMTVKRIKLLVGMRFS